MSGNTLLHPGFVPKTLLAWGVAALLLCQSTTVSAQTPTFSATASVKEAIVGLPFEVTFTLTDAEGQRFTPPSFREFKPAGTVSESRGMTFIKGRSSSRQSWTYTLEATRAGMMTIGPATVIANGRTFTTAPLSVQVLAQTATSKGGVAVPPGRDDQVFIAGSLSTQKVFPGQQVTWRLILYTRVAIEGADLISLPDFEGFYSKERRRFDTRTQYQTIKGKKYAIKTLHEESLFPQITGELTIGAAQIRVGIEQPGTQGFLFGPKPVTLTAQPITLTVVPLPDPAPERFTGGVGHYEWEVSADTAALTTDDALTLVVTLKGNGDARRFAAPKLTVPATCEIFEPRVLEEEEYENEQEIVHTKKLEYVILPKEPGNQEFIPVLTYFDVDSNRYCSIPGAPVRFSVTAGKNYRPSNALDSIPPPLTTAVQIGVLDKVMGFFVSPLFWSLLGVSLLAIGVVLFVKKRKASEPVHPAPLQHRPLDAFNAQQRFANVGNLLKLGAPETFYNELLKSLQSYIATRLELSPAQINQAVLRAKLAERSVTPIRVQAFLSIMQTCEQAVFSGHTDATKMESDWRTAQVVVQELEKEMR